MQPGTRQPAPHSNADRVFLLADDLTGACDSGAAFLASGHSVRVMLDAASPHGHHSESVLAFTTETRTLSPEQAAELVTGVVANLKNASSPHLLFKKVDSAARGHFGAETLAALNASGAVLALVAPAFPQAGRTVHAGILSIRDAAAQDTTVALRDLFPALEDSHIDTLAAAAEPELEQGIVRALATGIRVLLCDAQTQADLERLAAVASRLQQPILWTGSAGLAYALAATRPASSPMPPLQPTQREGRTILFVGTDHPVTTLQVSHLEADRSDHTIHRVNWKSPSPQEIRAAFAAAPTAALVLTGGETAAFVLRALGASSILLAGELAPGIPWGLIEGRAADGCIAVTKSGGFGAHDILLHAFEFCNRCCNGRACAPA
jgi:uncharacterized protein YgbK (DUF1537 family)